MKTSALNKWKAKIVSEANEDLDSRLGSYFQINSHLEKPKFDDKLEFQRVCITRYRTGSHNLRIELGRRSPYTPRENRLCICNSEIQTLSHCIIRCPLLRGIRVKYGINVLDDGMRNEKFLLEMERILGIK